MKALLHIGPLGSQYWQRNKAGWEVRASAPVGPVWALTDLAEEGFTQLQMPRLFGRDRRDYIRRQLVSRFPDTPFRLALPDVNRGSFWERLAPTRQLLLGVDAVDSIQAALGAQPMTLAGLWSTSMLLALIGRHPTMPSELFIVMPGKCGLRIVFLRDHRPVLTRLAPATQNATEQVAEVVRTLRHLENTREVVRSARRYAVLFLGDSIGLAAALGTQGLDRVAPPPPWRNALPTDWPFGLFDLTLKSPPGQLAPLEYRSAYVGQRLNRATGAAAALILGVTGWAVSHELQGSADAFNERVQVQAQIQQLDTELAQAGPVDMRWSVTPQLVRLTLDLDQQEVATARNIATDMKAISEVVGGSPAVRVSRLDWRVRSGSGACGVAFLGSAQPQTNPGETVSETAGVVEIRLELAFDETIAAPARTHTVAGISEGLSRLPGVELLLDPAFESARNLLSSDGTMQATQWCFTLGHVDNAQPERATPRGMDPTTRGPP